MTSINSDTYKGLYVSSIMNFKKYISTFVVTCLLPLVVGGQNTYGSYSLPGSCPKNLSFVDNLDLKALQGGWYVQYLSDNGSSVGCNGDCWTLYFSYLDDRTVIVNLCCQQDDTPLCGTSIGSGTFSDDNDNKGVLTYTNGGKNRTAFILYTDYDNVLIGYYCTLEADGSHKDNHYVYTRTRRGPTDLDTLVDEILQDNKLDLNRLVSIPQGKYCSYTIGCPGNRQKYDFDQSDESSSESSSSSSEED